MLFVLGSAVSVYFLFFRFVHSRGRTLNGESFSPPLRKSIDWKLALGSMLFGIGWGISGVCPGPALVHLAHLDTQISGFLATLFLGFEVQRRLD